MKELQTYDWEAVFEFTGWTQGRDPTTDGSAVGQRPQWCVGEESEGPVEPFGPADVARIIAKDEGENDEQSWLIVGELSSGLFFTIDAWCDYTGWDCQSGGCAIVSRNLAHLVQFALTAEDRTRLGLPA